MFAALIIVFREVVEAGLVVGVAGATSSRGPIFTAGLAGLVAGADQSPRLPVGVYGYAVLFAGMPSLRLPSGQDERRVSSSPGNAGQ